MLDNGSPYVLIADDLDWVREMWAKGLASYDISFVTASSLEELNEVFEMNCNLLDAVILDGCIPGHDVNTIGFIRMVRGKGLRIPIVASSSLPVYRQMMMNAGATHQAPKDDAVDAVADLLSAP